MAVDKETVRRVAHLARIRVEEAEVPALQKELNGILAFVEQLNAIDIEGVPAMNAGLPIDVPTKMRSDVITAGGEAAAVIANAPAQEDHYFLVPKVVE
jgi:aspartyl-tRNA(Asn)/glutamyl-tRNA(Gln) amidotransferase subunit C